MRLVEVKDEKALKDHNILFTTKTLYKWHSAKKFPTIFVKIGGKLFVDVDEWERLLKEGKLQ